MRYTGLLLLLISLSCAGQYKTAIPQVSIPGKPVSHGKKMGATGIKKQFPFNKCTNVLLLSFDNPFVDPGIVQANDTDKRMHTRANDGLRDTLGHKRVHEIMVLSHEQIGKAAALFYNSECRSSVTEMGCYFPRNAIVFLDSNAHVIAELEICFECRGYVMRPRKFPLGVMYSCRYNEFKQFFAGAGIKYGVAGKREY